MKMFALNFLADCLTQEELNSLGKLQISGFASFVAYLINREIDLANETISLSPYNLVKDGLGGACGEVLVPITLKFKDFEDRFLWDMANPDNSPHDFASQLGADLNLGQNVHERWFFAKAISCEIRKQLILFACKRIARFTFIYENYVETQLKTLLHQKEQANYEDPEAKTSAIDPQALFPGSSLREGVSS
mmetsp:Transcript_31768/g.48753  ORF Transcript_31768/g.48753 Transcript_31768/m.48753 type:complete len:191 (+) Transcript_31768:416-988(+)